MMLLGILLMVSGINALLLDFFFFWLTNQNNYKWFLSSDHILATAATNGAVVVWNLNKSSRSKQEHVFIDHKRTVNKVSFHMTEPMWLISGSQDGTMKCFDLRIKEATRTFYR